MAISGIQSIQSVYGQSASSGVFVKRAETPQESAAAQNDTVRISQEARNRTTNAANTTISSQAQSAEESSSGVLPVEAYSLPKWYADLMSDLTMLDTEIGISYAESNAARYDALSGREKNDLSEYHETLHSYFQEELDARGIDSARDYYNQIVLDPVNSEEVHQAVKQKLEGDARAMQLMEYFGISL